MKKLAISLTLISMLLTLSNCRTGTEYFGPSYLSLSSNSFKDTIPAKYTCLNAQQVYPQLEWSSSYNPDAERPKSYVLLMDDPDAVPIVGYIWNHWVLYDIPSNLNEIKEGTNRVGDFPEGVKRGLNSFGDSTYGGPCPPSGNAHHYRFKIFAIRKQTLGLPSKASVEQIRQSMAGNVIDSAVLICSFKR